MGVAAVWRSQGCANCELARNYTEYSLQLHHKEISDFCWSFYFWSRFIDMPSWGKPDILEGNKGGDHDNANRFSPGSSRPVRAE